MDPRRFEALSRRFAADASRRGLLRAATGLAAGVLTLRHADVALADAGSEGLPIVGCKPPGKRCSSDDRCCSGNCRRGVCTCAKKGRQCWEPLEGSLCCSQRCDHGKCA